MIQKVWRDNLLGINTIRTLKLTDEHFNKNAHSQMRVHLSVQVLSLSVLERLKKYCEGDAERTSEYESYYMEGIPESLTNDFYTLDTTIGYFPTLRLTDMYIPAGTAKPYCLHTEWNWKA